MCGVQLLVRVPVPPEPTVAAVGSGGGGRECDSYAGCYANAGALVSLQSPNEAVRACVLPSVPATGVKDVCICGCAAHQCDLLRAPVTATDSKPPRQLL